MREWKELFFSGKPLYEQACVDPAPAEPTPEQLIELQKEELLNSQDYDEYVVSAEREERHHYFFSVPSMVERFMYTYKYGELLIFGRK